MRKITVDVSIRHPEYLERVREAKKVIHRHVPRCPPQGTRVEGIDFALNITPLKSAVGRQEWFVEYVNTAKKEWWEPNDSIACIYDVRKGYLVLFEIWRHA
jgi:hypothetical protein